MRCYPVASLVVEVIMEGGGGEREGKGGGEATSIFLSRTFVKCSIVP